MRDLNRYVINLHAAHWRDIGIELGLKLQVINNIEERYRQQNTYCLQQTLDKWLQLSPTTATWKTLEVALTNVRRQQLGLDPVDDVYGEDGNNTP